MTTETVFAFDEKTARLLQKDHHWLMTQVRRLVDRPESRERDSCPGWQVRTGKTGTNTANPTYPTSGDTFFVNWDDWSFTETPGAQTVTKRAWAQGGCIAHTEDGSYVAQNTPVIVYKHRGPNRPYWWIRPIATPIRAARVIVSSGGVGTNNTVEAELGTLTYSPSVGRRTRTFTPDSPQSLVIVHEMNGPPPRNPDVLLVTQVDGRWQLVRTTARSRLKGTVFSPSGITPGSSGNIVIWENGLQSARVEIAWLNWMATSTLAYQKKVIIEWFEDEAKWVITNAEC